MPPLSPSSSSAPWAFAPHAPSSFSLPFSLPSWAVRAENLARVCAADVAASIKHALQWGSSHTGLPVVVVATLALVLAWRVARRTWHVIFELGLAFALLFAATRLGWIRW